MGGDVDGVPYALDSGRKRSVAVPRTDVAHGSFNVIHIFTWGRKMSAHV